MESIKQYNAKWCAIVLLIQSKHNQVRIANRYRSNFEHLKACYEQKMKSEKWSLFQKRKKALVSESLLNFIIQDMLSAICFLNFDVMF